MTSLVTGESKSNGERKVVSAEPDDSSDGGKELQRLRSRTTGVPYKICQTIVVIMGSVVTGIFIEMIGPTLPDLMKRVNSNYEAISRTLAARSVGHIISSITGGIISVRLKAEVGAFLSVGFMLGAIGTVAAPWCHTLLLLTFCLFLQGLANGTMDTLCTYFCTKLWSKRAALPLHSLHFGYGVGALIAPQISLPFLAKQSSMAENISSPLLELNSTSNILLWNDSATTIDTQTSRIEIAYCISGSLTILVGILVSMFYFYEKYVYCKSNPQRDETGPTVSQSIKCERCTGCCKTKETILRTFYLIIMICLLFNSNGGLAGFTKFLYTFATKGDLKMLESHATALNSAFWFSFTCGRGVGLIMSKWISPNIMLAVSVVFNAISGVLLYVWGDKMPLMLWITTCLFGFTSGPMIPTGFACTNLYSSLDGAVVSVMFISIAAGPLVYQWLTGFLFQHYGPRVLMPMMLGYSIGLVILLVILYVTMRKVPRRFDTVVEVSVNDDIEKETDETLMVKNGDILIEKNNEDLNKSERNPNSDDLCAEESNTLLKG